MEGMGLERTSVRQVMVCVGLGLTLALPPAHAQRRPIDIPDTLTKPERGRTRLIMKDGSYQIVLRYDIVGDVVRYKSAERNGAMEDVPLALVDLAATVRWKQEHTAGNDSGPPVLSPELAHEEAARAALTLEIKPGLRLPGQGSVLVLDTFEDVPELVPLAQEGSDLNKETAHAVQKKAIHPGSSAHEIFEIAGPRSEIQLHVPVPIFYVRIGVDEPDPSGGNALTVATHGAGAVPEREVSAGGAESSDYVIERVDARQDVRVVESFRLGLLGTGRIQPDVIEMREEPQPGGRWLKLTPQQPLEFGEYALVEVIPPQSLNLDVWDFGIHSDAPENVEAIRPEPRGPLKLQPRD
jgi:hypothetical protein